MTTTGSVRAPSRDEPIDVVRAIAILGMFVIHAVLVLGREYPTAGVDGLVLWLCDGRAAATFVTLAGFGVARLIAKYPPEQAVRTLRRRAVVLWILGVINLIVWPGDILRVYALALLGAPAMLRWRARTRIWFAVGLCAVFVAATMLLDWTRHWNLATLTYVGVWTAEGFVRNLLFDGFRPVVPWIAFFLLGTVIAGWDLRSTRLQFQLVLFGAAAMVTSIALSVSLDAVLQTTSPEMTALTREGTVGTTSLPPMPLFMLSALGSTTLLLGTVLLLMRHVPTTIVQLLIATGRRALSWYALHIAVLMLLHSAGLKNVLAVPAAIAVGVAMFLVAALWSYHHRGTNGALERILRRVGDGATSERSARERAQ